MEGPELAVLHGSVPAEVVHEHIGIALLQLPFRLQNRFGARISIG